MGLGLGLGLGLGWGLGSGAGLQPDGSLEELVLALVEAEGVRVT